MRAVVARRLGRVVVLAALASGAGLPGAVLGTSVAAAAEAGPSDGTAYPGDPDSEAALVAAEDERLTEVRTISSLSAWSATPIESPYRLATGSAYTLVLTPRSDPYTVQDLVSLAPQTFVRRPDGSYLLSENIVVELGATLNLADPGGLTLLLASDAEGFVSIVNYGGRLNIAGTSGAPATVSSFDRSSETTDTTTSDGRAYLRSIGGQVGITDAAISGLGFWSGRTGGLSLTGTDRPSSGSLDALSDLVDVGELTDTAPQVEGNRDSALGAVLPAGELPVPTVDGAAPAYSYVSAAITRTTVDHNAYGLFVSGANGLDVRDSSFDDNLVSGVVLHRFVVNAVLEATRARDNLQDGIVLARATTGIVLSEVTADANHRNGLTMSGEPLANGPSATGTSVASYGNNTVSNSQASDNGRYGVEVIGGTNIGVLANDVARNEMGIVVRETADDVKVVGNAVTDSASQGIAVRDGATNVTVSGNTVQGGVTSLYLRDSTADVQRNTFTDAATHAISLVGATGATVLAANKISGRGPSAIDTQRAPDFDRRDGVNDTSGWHDTTPFLVTLKRFLQPLTAMWIVLGLLLVFTAVHGARARRTKRHPYADKVPLSALTGTGQPPRDPEPAGA